MIHRFKLLQADALIKNDIGTQENRDAMKTIAFQQRETVSQQGLDFSNKGCWRQEFRYPDMEWLMTDIRGSVNELISIYAQEDPIYSKKIESYGIPQIEYWTNINEPGSMNVMHDHRLHHYVAVYYIQGTDTGDIVWHNPINVTQSCHPHGPFVSRYSYTPKDGDLIVWPAWMPHETEINQSDRQRINVAFNIRFETPRYM
jgi:uncharacterized protein (TIGR02466 family)